jgi:hypothetical protein
LVEFKIYNYAEFYSAIEFYPMPVDVPLQFSAREMFWCGPPKAALMDM